MAFCVVFDDMVDFSCAGLMDKTGAVDSRADASLAEVLFAGLICVANADSLLFLRLDFVIRVVEGVALGLAGIAWRKKRLKDGSRVWIVQSSGQEYFKNADF